MKIINFVLILLYLLSNSYPAALGETKKELTKEELFSIYSNKLNQLKLSMANLDNVKIDNFNVYYNEREDRRRIPDVGCKGFEVSMKLDPITGVVLYCSNDYILKKITAPDAPIFKGGAKPTKNKNAIIKEAEGYLKILYGTIPQDAFFDKAEYNANMGPDTTHSYEGNWAVDWGRKTGGYVYQFDSITVVVHEKYGFSGYGYNFFSDSPKSLIVDVTKERAIEIAKPFAKKMARFFGCKLGDVVSAEPMITNPNFFKGQFAEGFRRIGIKDYSKYPASYSRLAWIVSFSWGYDKIFTKNYNPMTVWIDAETGEVLGGG
ncbi:MAG: PepSY domain-containing protein [Candidatus Omnitrophica bacterium]|nr:PepSY domain-containing protein [Candidatus Omnitrophota bacterium]